jgi:ribosomal protein S27E
MNGEDRRRASTDARIELRRQALKLREQGRTLAEICEVTGYKVPYLSTLLRSLAADPKQASTVRRGGRPKASGRPLPGYMQKEFEAYLKCGRLEHGFLRVRCEDCHAEKLVAFSCKGRGLCPSCGARRMVESAVLLADEVLPQQPRRQWVVSFPIALRFLLATHPQVLTHVLGIV